MAQAIVNWVNDETPLNAENLKKITPIIDNKCSIGSTRGITAFRIGNLAVVSGRQELSSNSSGVKVLDIALPYKFTACSLADNAYGMSYIDMENNANYQATILHSNTNNDTTDGKTHIKGHVNYHTQSSYQMYAYTVIGTIE